MPEFTQEQAQKFAERTFKLSAKTIYEKLETVRNENKVIRRRWFWELLQNAKDAVNITDKVSVRLTIGMKDEGHFLKFSHNGKPFRLQDAENLIFPYSDKAEEEESDKSGQFGTGFLATHYLSDKIKVSGVLIEDEKPHSFSFILDRSGKTKSIIAESVNSSWQEFSEKKQGLADYSYSSTKFETSFEYFPSQEKIKEIFEELDQIKETLPYVLSFVDKIDQVEIHDEVHSTSTTFQKDHVNSKVITENISSIKISKLDNLSKANCIELVIAEQDDVQIAIEVGKQNEIRFVKEFDDKLPLFYCPFPLIGADPYQYPVVVNCIDFHPKEERNGIWLADSENGINNKNLLAKTIPLYAQLLNYLANNSYKNLFFLLKSLKGSKSIVDMDSSEFNNTMRAPLRNIALQSPLVDTPTGERLAIKSESHTIYFGKHSDAEKRKDFWQFIKSLHPEQVPTEVDIDGWHKVIWDDCPSYTVKELTEKIAAVSRQNLPE